MHQFAVVNPQHTSQELQYLSSVCVCVCVCVLVGVPMSNQAPQVMWNIPSESDKVGIN